jgi:hypothetical protein
LFCSESCRVQHKKESKQSYGNLPHIAEKRKAKARQLSKTDQYKQKRNARARDHLKQKRQTDPIYLLKEQIRCRTKAAFNGIGFVKGCKTREMIGCSWDQFKIHIESQFEKGMKWSNRHLWHIDHIIPLAEGKTVEQLEKLSHFSNLRPMWAVDNLAKKDNPVDCQPELRISYE